VPDAPLPSSVYSEDVIFDKKEFPMNAQTLTTPSLNCSLVISSLPINFPTAHLIQACSRDYGFDFDEEEMGQELLAPLPASLSSQAIPEMEADEFEQAFKCFLS
jgi:hypothetical protein